MLGNKSNCRAPIAEATYSIATGRCQGFCVVRYQKSLNRQRGKSRAHHGHVRNLTPPAWFELGIVKIAVLLVLSIGERQ